MKVRLSQALEPSLEAAWHYVYFPTVHIQTQIAYNCLDYMADDLLKSLCDFVVVSSDFIVV